MEIDAKRRDYCRNHEEEIVAIIVNSISCGQALITNKDPSIAPFDLADIDFANELGGLSGYAHQSEDYGL